MQLGGVEHIVFTGGIGENSPLIRERVCRKLSVLGVELDVAVNESKPSDTVITKPASKVSVHVVSTDEEAIVVRKTYQHLQEI